MSWLNEIYPSYFCTIHILVEILFKPSQEKEKIIYSLIKFLSVRIPGDFTFKAFQFQRTQMDMLWNFQKLWSSQSSKSASLFWNSESQDDIFSKIICEFHWFLRTSIVKKTPTLDMVKCFRNFRQHDFEFFILNFSVASYGNNFYASVLHFRDIWKKWKNTLIPKFQ